ncbi:MAG: PilN domain-containing protein [Patescibacteria group bacterium]|nr:PilN domain-containing protein [Patescibacteria group bacterium]
MPAQNNSFSLNLLPTDNIEKTPAGKFLKWALSVGRYIVIFTELIVLAAFFSRFYFDRKLSDLHETIAQKQAIVESASDLETQARLIQGRLSAVKTILSQDTRAKGILMILAQITPTDIVYDNLNITNQSITVTAVTASEASLGVFLSNLNTAKFTDISLDSVDKNKYKGAGIRFTVSAKYSPDFILKGT